MDTKTLIGRAARIAATAHEGQTDKAGEAYILHPLRLMAKAETDDAKIVALLHDVVEDSEMRLDDLRNEGFPPEILAAIDALTHRENEPYEDAISRAIADPLAAQVKKLDLEDKMTMMRLKELTDKDWERIKRYHIAYRRILAALGSPHDAQ